MRNVMIYFLLFLIYSFCGWAIEVIGNESKRRTEIVPSTASYDIGRYASFPVEVQVGGATIFVIDVEQFYKL